jgi:hypothetical protein
MTYMKEISLGQPKLFNIVREFFYARMKVIKNLDATIVGPFLYVVKLGSCW